jgi:hypothetical protein
LKNVLPAANCNEIVRATLEVERRLPDAARKEAFLLEEQFQPLKDFITDSIADLFHRLIMPAILDQRLSFSDFRTGDTVAPPPVEADAAPAADRLVIRMGSNHQDVQSADPPLRFESSDPALRFLALLRAALVSGAAHVADRHEHAPGDPGAWGWRSGQGCWIPSGVRIGWLSGADLLLDPDTSYRVAQQIAGSERIPLSEQTLRQRLADRGLLASIDAKRETLKVRRTIEGVPRQVLHMRATDVLEA